MRKAKPGKTKVVLFDFDGTLSAHDANSRFMRYCFRHSLRPWVFLPLMGLALVAKLVSGEKFPVLWRETLRRYLTAGMVKKLAPGFIELHKRERFGWAAAQVAKERAEGSITVLTSAGPHYLILPLARDMEFDCIICSDMDKARPWKYNFLNYGKNKTASLAFLNGGDFEIIRAYSDSKSDIPIMRLAREQVWINPKTGCRIAGFRG
jgi:phosphoserine phosphatase